MIFLRPGMFSKTKTFPQCTPYMYILIYMKGSKFLQMAIYCIYVIVCVYMYMYFKFCFGFKCLDQINMARYSMFVSLALRGLKNIIEN